MRSRPSIHAVGLLAMSRSQFDRALEWRASRRSRAVFKSASFSSIPAKVTCCSVVGALTKGGEFPYLNALPFSGTLLKYANSS